MKKNLPFLLTTASVLFSYAANELCHSDIKCFVEGEAGLTRIPTSNHKNNIPALTKPASTTTNETSSKIGYIS
jgi:hypothetical protein